MDLFIKNNKIKQYYLSEKLKLNANYKNIIFPIDSYQYNNLSTIFIGIFTFKDQQILKKHKGSKFIYWSGEDTNITIDKTFDNISFIKTQNIIKHVTENKLAQYNLNNIGIQSEIINLLEKKKLINSNIEFNINKFKQIYISSALIHLKDQILNKFDLKLYNNKYQDCIFFGLYNTLDIQNINNHLGKKYLIWGGNDALFESKSIYLNYLDNYNLYHVAISNDLLRRLRSFDIDPYIFNLNLVDRNLFKPVNKLGNKIFIYNGIKKGNEEVYGKKIYESIVSELQNLEFIYSNELNIPNNEMPKIYEQCFIGLRLTINDGNANMVQEMEAMNIPVVHNLSDYGLKCKTVNYIKNHIKNNKKF